MVRFRLVYQDDRIIQFWYFPEGNEYNYGIITVDKEVNTIEITKISPDDFSREISADSLTEMRNSINIMRKERGEPEITEDELPIATETIISYYYGDHAIQKITEALNNGEIPNSGSSVWY